MLVSIDADALYETEQFKAIKGACEDLIAMWAREREDNLRRESLEHLFVDIEEAGAAALPVYFVARNADGTIHKHVDSERVAD